MGNQPSLLWRIDRDDLPGTSYLFGTMHVRDRKAFGLVTKAESVIQYCEAVATEYDLEASNNPDVSSLLPFSKNETVRNVLPEKTRGKLRKILAKMAGMDLRYFEDIHPFMLINTISSMILSRDMPFSLDEHLWQLAKSMDKQTLGIETLEEQLAIVNKIPVEAHAKTLAHMATNFPAYRRQTLKMADWYARGDLAQLHRAALKGQGRLKQLLIYERNATMADRIEIMATEQTTFFAVGAGHLSGKQGLLRLLKFKGLKAKSLS